MRVERGGVYPQFPNLDLSASLAEAGWGAAGDPPPADIEALFTWPWRGRGVASGPEPLLDGSVSGSPPPVGEELVAATAVLLAGPGVPLLQK